MSFMVIIIVNIFNYNIRIAKRQCDYISQQKFTFYNIPCAVCFRGFLSRKNTPRRLHFCPKCANIPLD